MLTNAFTCTGPYAVLIMLGIKHVENRSMMPMPSSGRCAVSCSKSFCREEYGNFIQWASKSLAPKYFDEIPAWSDISDWSGTIIGTCAYSCRSRNDLKLSVDPVELPTNAITWDEGYPYWWDLSDVVCFDRPIPCRGNVGMWQMPESLAVQVCYDVAKVFRLAVHVVSSCEGFFVLPLDAKKHVLSRPILVSLGISSASATVIIKDVLSEAIRVGADSIVVAHNHPHGTLSPSEDDLQTTSRLIELCRTIGMPLLDHIILDSSPGSSGFVSIRGAGALNF